MLHYFVKFLENAKSYYESHSRCEHPWPFGYKMQCSDLPRPKSQGWSARAGNVPPKPQNEEKFRNSVPTEFMITPSHVLYSNLAKIVRREVGETMRCFADKKFAKCASSAPVCVRLAEGAKRLQENVPRDPYVSCKISSQLPVGSDLPELFPKSDFVRSQYMPSALQESFAFLRSAQSYFGFGSSSTI